MQNPEPFFGGQSPLSKTSAVVSHAAPSDENKALLAKLKHIRASVTAAKAALTPPGKKVPLKQTNESLVAALTADPRSLPPGGLKAAVTEFQALVPIVSPTELASVTVAHSVGIDLLRRQQELFENEEISEERFKAVIGELAKVSKIALPPKGKAGVLAEQLLTEMEKIECGGSTWVERGRGSESKVFTAIGTGFVYKVSPIKESILDIPVIKDDGPLYPRLQSYPLAGPGGTCPLVERLEHMASINGLASADLVGLTSTGSLIFRQIDLGDKEPQMDGLLAWVAGSDLCALPNQADDPIGQFDNDTSILPVVALIDGKPVLMLDVNPRNSRVYGGNAVVFDAVSRELSDSEVACNPEISKALGEIKAGQTIQLPPSVSTLKAPRVRSQEMSDL